MTIRRKKYLIPISAGVETALKHTAVGRGMTVSATIAAAIVEFAQRDGWLPVPCSASATVSPDDSVTPERLTEAVCSPAGALHKQAGAGTDVEQPGS
jgi:hypothetical protein